MVLRGGGCGFFFTPENDGRSDVLTKNYRFAVREDIFNSRHLFLSTNASTSRYAIRRPRCWGITLAVVRLSGRGVLVRVS
jgi:hypothetical protein